MGTISPGPGACAAPPCRPTLRPYQAEAVAELRHALRSSRRVLFQLATGGGKSVILAEIADGAVKKGKRVLLLVHRIELVRQLVRTLRSFGHEPALLIAGGQPDPAAALTVANINTAARRELPAYDLILQDEAHHMPAGMFASVHAGQPQARILGVTATPRRLDGKGLDEHFDGLVQGPSVRWLQEQGFLAPLAAHVTPYAAFRQLRLINDTIPPAELERVLGPFTELALDEWQRLAPGLPTIAFAASIRHASYVLAQAKARGISAGVVTGDQLPREREAVLAAYAEGRITLLLSVDLIDEGFDVPETGCILQLRPTQSLVKHFQQIGRGMRPKAGDAPCTLIDLAGNIERIAELEGSGLPTEVVDWSLEGEARREREPAGERPEDAEPMEIDPMALAAQTVPLADMFGNCRSFGEALSVCVKPADLVVLRRSWPNPKTGKPFHLGFMINLAREKFFPSFPHHQGLEAAAAGMGLVRFLQAARLRGDRWTQPRPLAERVA